MAYTFPMEQQQETEWCWAAVAVSVEHYFDPTSKKTQRSLVEQVKGQVIDATGYLAPALDAAGVPHSSTGRVGFLKIQQQLLANLPVCVHIEWNDGIGDSHYVVISGYGVSPAGNALVYVSDPILTEGSNEVIWDFDSFVDAYSPAYAKGILGTWVDTCLVTPNLGA